MESAAEEETTESENPVETQELQEESEPAVEEETTAIIDIDLSRCEQVRRWWPFLRDRRIDEYGDITKRFID